MTLTEILAHIKRAYPSSDDTKATAWVNECYKKLAVIARLTKDSTSAFTLVAGTAEYALPSDCHLVESVVWDNVPLKPTTFEVLDSIDSYWRTATSGTPTYYIVRRTVGKIYFHVPPDATAITKVVKLTYRYVPADLSGSATPLIAAPYHDLLVDYGVWKQAEANEDFEIAARWAPVYYAREKEFAVDMAREHSEYPKTRISWHPFTRNRLGRETLYV